MQSVFPFTCLGGHDFFRKAVPNDTYTTFIVSLYETIFGDFQLESSLKLNSVACFCSVLYNKCAI